MAAFALDPEPEHDLVDTLHVDGGFRGACSCGSQSQVQPVALAALDEWADHVRAIERSRTRHDAVT